MTTTITLEDDEIAIVWSVADVLEVRPDLTEDQAGLFDVSAERSQRMHAKLKRAIALVRQDGPHIKELLLAEHIDSPINQLHLPLLGKVAGPLSDLR